MPVVLCLRSTMSLSRSIPTKDPPLPGNHTLNSSNDISKFSHGAKDTTLEHNALERTSMNLVRRRSGAILDNNTIVTAIIGLAHRAADADIRRHARQDQVLDTPHPQ